ncbi:MAG: hypothetical protein WA885_17225 [Phormidesmis sp.]
MSVNNLLSEGFSKAFSRSVTFWNNYWFYPAPLFNLALCRIIIVGFQLCFLFIKDYGSEVLTRASVPSSIYNPLPVLQGLNVFFPWESPPDFFLTAVFWLASVFGVLALIGLKTNISLFVFAIGNLYIQSYLYSFGKFHHPEALMLIALVVLALSPSGKLLSIDACNYRNLKRQSTRNSSHLSASASRSSDILRASSPFARWPLLLIQWLFALAYLSAGLNKLVLDGPGLFTLDWMNGYTLQYYLISDGLLWGSSLGVWLGHQHTLVLVFSFVAILFEATFFLTLLFPKLIWFYIPAGTMFHLGIYMAQRAPFFQYIALYAVFIPWAAVIKMLLGRLRGTASIERY